MLRAISDADEDGEGGNPWGNPWEACVEVDQTEEDFRGWEGGGVSPPKVRAGVMVRQVDSNTRHPILRWKSFLGKRS